MARVTQDSSSDSGSLNDYLGTFFGGPSSSGSDPTAGSYAGSIAQPTQPQLDTPPTRGPLVAHGDPAGNSTNVSNPANQYTASPGFNWSQYTDPLQGLTSALNSGQYGNPQSAIDAFNQQNYAHYGYGSGPMYQPNTNTVGIASGPSTGPYGGYLVQDPKTGQWGWVAHTAPEGGAGGLTPGAGTGFADPAYQQLSDLVQQRLTALQQPQTFPQLDQYMSMLTANEAQAKQRAQTFADQLTGRINQLQQPLLTDANVAQQHALASNNLIASRDNALAAARADLARRGFDPNSSGLSLNQQNTIGQQYSNAQSNIDAQLQAQQIQGDEQRRNEATQLQGLVQQALQGGDVTALQNQAQVADLENQLFNLGQNQQREQLSTAEIPVNLTNQGFANAVNASNSVSSPLQSLLYLTMLGNQQQGLQQNQTNANAAGLAWLIQQALG